MPNEPYTIDDVIRTSGATQFPIPASAQNTFLGQINPASVTSGEFIGNSVVKDGYMQSGNFVTGVSGWKLWATGVLEAMGATINGAITAVSGVIGGFNIGSTYIRDVANTFGLSSDVTTDDDVRFWAGDFYENRATAPFRVTESGAGALANVTITGGTVGSSVAVALGALDLAARGWTQTCVFSVTTATTVAWGSGTFVSADGAYSLSISAGSTSSMTAKTYVYLDVNTSLSAYQITTTATTAIGAGKVLIAIAQNGTGEATYQVLSGQGGQNIDAANIVANSITGNELSASILYAGSIEVDSSGNIRSGQTTYNTGTGWFIGNSGGTSKLSIGNPTVNYLTWDGTYVRIKGSLDVGTNGVINNSSYLVAALPVPAVSVGFNVPSAYE